MGRPVMQSHQQQVWVPHEAGRCSPRTSGSTMCWGFWRHLCVSWYANIFGVILRSLGAKIWAAIGSKLICLTNKSCSRPVGTVTEASKLPGMCHTTRPMKAQMPWAAAHWSLYVLT